MFFLLIICIVILIIPFLKFNVSIEFLRDGANDRAIITISIIRNLIKLDIPFVDAGRKKGFWGIRFSKKIKSGKGKEIKPKDKSFLSFSKLQNIMKTGYDQFSKFKDILNPVRNYMKKRLVCDNLLFHLDFGFGDASLTGVSSGFLWGICYNVVSILDRNMVLRDPDIKINPTFNEAKLHVKLYCIFSIRIVHIIIVFFILLFSIIKYIIKKWFLSHEMNTTQNYVKL